MKLNYINHIFYKLICTFINLKNNESAKFLDNLRFLLLNIQLGFEEEIKCKNKHGLRQSSIFFELKTSS